MCFITGDISRSTVLLLSPVFACPKTVERFLTDHLQLESLFRKRIFERIDRWKTKRKVGKRRTAN